MQALTELVNKLDNELAKVKTQLENTSGTLADDSKHVEEAKKAVKEVSPPGNVLYQCTDASADQVTRDKTGIELYSYLFVLRNEIRL